MSEGVNLMDIKLEPFPAEIGKLARETAEREASTAEAVRDYYNGALWMWNIIRKDRNIGWSSPTRELSSGEIMKKYAIGSTTTLLRFRDMGCPFTWKGAAVYYPEDAFHSWYVDYKAREPVNRSKAQRSRWSNVKRSRKEGS